MKNLVAYLILSACSVSLFAGIHVSEDLVQRYFVCKGQKISGQITITNMGVDDELVKLEVCDYATSHTGKVFFDAPNTRTRSAAPWLHVAASSIFLSVGEQKSVPYELIVPEIDGLLGSYWSMILVAPEAKFKPTEGMGVSTIIRYGIIVLAELGGDSESSVKIGENGICSHFDKRVYWFELFNDGDIMLRPKISLELIDSDGNVAYVPKSLPDGFLFPGSSSKVEFDITTAPLGKFTALITIDAGEDRVFGAQYQVDVVDLPIEPRIDAEKGQTEETSIIDSTARESDLYEYLLNQILVKVTLDPVFYSELDNFIAVQLEQIGRGVISCSE